VFVGCFYGVIAFLCGITHDKGSALYKYPTTSCKNNLEISTNPNIFLLFFKKAAAYYLCSGFIIIQ
jgi:hypothetical protein